MRPLDPAILLDEARALARERGGRLLDDHVPGTAAKVPWQCAQGHRWQAPLRSVKLGSWCWVCSKRVPSIEDMRRLAAERGGKCLSRVYVNQRTPLEWRCAQGHTWKTTSPMILRHHWCPYCAQTRKLELKELRKIARLRGGRLLSRTYLHCKAPLWWSCARKHIWRAPAKRVKAGKHRRGTWCRLCAIIARRGWKPHFNTIEEMQDLARRRGGECLSEFYVNSKTKLRWRCARGHEWEAVPKSIKTDGYWCPVCGKRPIPLARLLKLAARRQYQLISEAPEFVSGPTLLKWECPQGHRWEARADRTKQKSCPKCARNRLGSLAEMQEIARRHGGECLSKRYANSITPLRWRCARGHVWKAPPNALKAFSYASKGHWCKRCFHDSIRRSLDEMQVLARARGGRCLATRYINASTPLIWQCREGHVWKGLPKNIIKGNWCRKCAYKQRRLTIEAVQDLAHARGGECLSRDYVNNDTPMRWRCGKGHTWTQPFSFIKIRLSKPTGSFCPACGGRWRK